MDLATALRIVSTRLHVPGTSDPSLVRLVTALAAPHRPRLCAAADLEGGAPMRVADALLSLARATQPRYRADVHDAHARWALLRYLGVFDVLGYRLGLSEAGRRIVGNQRRVLSEELGIGFAAQLAESWFAAVDKTTAMTVRILDIDVLLSDLHHPRLAVSAASTRRPDYLLIGDYGQGRRVKLALLECKGTKSRGYAPKQLAAASEQLVGITVNGATLPGLAVSSVIADDTVEYLAVQRLAERLPPSASEYVRDGQQDANITDRDIIGGEWGDSGTIFDVPEFSSAVEVEARGRASENAATAFAETALAASWATLADLAGNEEGVARWSPERRRDPTRRVARPRQEFRAPGGPAVRGVSNLLTLPGGQLEVTLGVIDEMDEALTSGNSDDILRVQRAAAVSGRALRELHWDTDVVAAYGDDGSALLLTPR